MKYIDAERLKAEIDKRYAEYRAKMKTDDFTYYEGMADALDLFEQFIDSLQQEQPKSTCKTCGFYENNCPFIRGKLIPYPNKVCKDYTFSTLKAEQEPVSDGLEEAAEKIVIQLHPSMEYSSVLGDKLTMGELVELVKAGAEWEMHYQEKKIADAYEKGKQEGIRVVRSWESSPGQGGY